MHIKSGIRQKKQQRKEYEWTINSVGIVNITDVKKHINIFVKTGNQGNLIRILHHFRDAVVFRLKHICNRKNNKK